MDFGKAKELLDVATASLAFGNRFRSIHDAALVELDKIANPPAKPELTRPVIQSHTKVEPDQPSTNSRRV